MTYEVSTGVNRDLLAQELAAEVVSGGLFGSGEMHDEYGQQSYNASLQRLLNSPSQSRPLDEADHTSVRDIVLDGTLGSARFEEDIIDTGIYAVYPPSFIPYRPYDYRLAMLGVYLRNPEAAAAVAESHIIGVHGTGSGTLLSVTEHGLLPLNDLRDQQLLVPNGAKDIWGTDERVNTSVRFLPFTEGRSRQVREYTPRLPITDSALLTEMGMVTNEMRRIVADDSGSDQYAYYREQRGQALGRNLLELQAVRLFLSRPARDAKEALLQRLVGENFPVVYGVDVEQIPRDKTVPISSSVSGEFALSAQIVAQAIPIVFVPRGKQAFVEGILADQGSAMRVLAIEDVPDFDPVRSVQI